MSTKEENNNGDGENYTCNISNNVNSMSTTSAKLPVETKEIQQTNVKIIIDLSFDEYMNDAEIISLSSQLTRCYSTNRSTINPVDLIFTSFNKRIEERFVLRLKDYLNWKNISFHSQYYLNYFNTDNNNRTNSDGGDDGGNGKLIYLTADSDNIINTLDENNIYIIGGIVDKNRHKSLCYNKAVEEGIETARLPIENFIKLSSRKVLAINHVFDILIKWLEHKDWEKAFLESEFKQILRKSTHEKSKTAEKTLSSPTSRKRKSNVIKTKFSKITSKANQTLSKRTGITNSKYIKRDSKSKPSLMKQKLKTVTDKNDDDEMSSNNNLESKKRQSEKTIVQTYNVMEVNKLSKEFPDEYWQFHAESGYGMISSILGMVLSPDGTMLATLSIYGVVKIWDTIDFRMLQKMRDVKEKNIDEFYVGKFTPSHTHLIVGGKLKDRYKWDEEERDNPVLPGPLKIFDVIAGECIGKLEGHVEEVLSIKSVIFKGENYYITTSQDGYFIKWKMDDDWITLKEKILIEDGYIVFYISFLPNTGNKYFLAAIDDIIKLYDFETGQLLQNFEESLYSQYCDCVKFIHPKILSGNRCKSPQPSESTATPLQYAYFITRGVETIVSEYAKIARNGEDFLLEKVRIFQHDSYVSNSWFVKVSSNGRYLAAPTMKGEVCIFNLRTGNIVAILDDHEI
ncbi:14337_t:CDS:10 [Entrophospora sp. SA101]|nr:14337_t:CDS:10 [Entrophospora sp. SA101]